MSAGDLVRLEIETALTCRKEDVTAILDAVEDGVNGVHHGRQVITEQLVGREYDLRLEPGRWTTRVRQ